MLHVASISAGCQRQLPIVDDSTDIVADKNTEMGSDAGSAEPSPSSHEPATNDPVVLSLRHTHPEFEIERGQDFYRVDLSWLDGKVSVTSLAVVHSDIRPLPTSSPQYFVVAHRGDEVVEAIPIKFPSRAHEFVLDESGDWVDSAVDVTTGSTTAFIEITDEIDGLEVVDRSGAVVAEIDAAELAKAASEPVAGQSQALHAGELSTRYPHIKFLQDHDDYVLDKTLQKGGSVVSVTDELASALDDGLSKLAPAVLASVQTIGLVQYTKSLSHPKEGTTLGGNTIGPQITLNVEIGDLAYAVVHEAAHAFADLTNDAASDGMTNRVEDWPPMLRASAQRLVNRYHLLRGVVDAWSKLQQTGVEAGVASDYLGNDYRSLELQAAIERGFATRYGARNATEDFAEYIVQLTARDAPTLCQRFAQDSGTSPQLAIPFAKLVLSFAIGAINQVPYERCVANYSVIPKDPGVVVPGVVTFDMGLSAGFDTDEIPSFSVRGAGPQTYTIRITVRLPDKGTSPIGLHRLDDIWLGTLGSANSSNLVALLNDNNLLTRASSDGLLLVSNATDNSAEGVVFCLGLQNFLGIRTDSFPLVPFKVSR